MAYFSFRSFVANQQSTEPAQTIMAPCQKESPNDVDKRTEDNADDKTGIK
ncbi:hypothetical protein QWZ06_14075 [Chryseobacterium tructae]|nr:hypothetical protein [Chryseobacterium tructae]MDN3693333.1 hypothetical protein [Chryseobacterium tructae]